MAPRKRTSRGGERPGVDRLGGAEQTPIDVDKTRRALRDRYELGEVIGEGGMSVVYVARDLRYGREVAIKILRPRFSAAVAKERFHNEIKVVAGLSHPHILPLYDSGAVEDIHFYVMPRVRGGSLRERLREDIFLPVNQAVRIAAQVASALDFAQRHGIIHRDVKPENILMHENEPMLVDFGIALAESTPATQRLTEVGWIIGTRKYMSPEQLAGDTIDGRTDVYSLGCVLFEMLGGELPFSHSDANATTVAARLPASVPWSVSTIVASAVAPSVTDRCQSAGALAEALRTLDVAALRTTGTTETPETGDQSGHDSIVVLPFENLSADPENQYFCDGMTEEIINALSSVAALHVASKISSFAMKQQHLDLRQIGERLGVRHVVEGSVRRAGNRIRVIARLSNATNGRQLWSQRFDREAGDIFELQDEIAKTIANASTATLTQDGHRIFIERGTANLEAYDLYLKGRHFWRTRALRKAIEAFDEAISKDPEYALAYCGLADSYCSLSVYGFIPSRIAFERATAAADKAVAVADTLADAHYSIGLTKFMFDLDARAATDAFLRAGTLRPQLAQAHAQRAQTLAVLGAADEADEAGRRAAKLEPLSPFILATVAFAYLIGRRFETALDYCERALDLDAFSVPALWVMGLALVELEKFETAITALERSVTYSQRSPLTLSCLGGGYAVSGRREAALEVLTELDQRAKTAYVPPTMVAWIHQYLGNSDEAYACLAQGIQHKNAGVLYFACYPGAMGARTRASQKFRALLDTAHLTPLLEYWSAKD
jgi:eukaryotic-like serine/threonine-protein kinase